MEVLDSNPFGAFGDGGDDPDKPGQDPIQPPQGQPVTPGEKDREGQTPEIPKEDIPRPRSTFGRYTGTSLGGTLGRKTTIKVGYPCKNCQHVHTDHSMYEPRLCLANDCKCSGLLIDHKDIPSRYK